MGTQRRPVSQGVSRSTGGGLLAPPSPGEAHQCPGGGVPGAGSGRGPWSHGGGLLPRPYMPSFPPSLSPRSSASSITARVSRCQMGRATFPEPPRGPPLPRPDSGTGRHLGAFPVWLQVPGPAGHSWIERNEREFG